MPVLSAIIVNYNTGEYVHRCIDSVLANAPEGGVEVIVVDNASTDGSLATLVERDDVLLVASERNLGYAGGCNAGARISTGDFIIFLNPDLEVGPGVLQRLVDFLENKPKAGAAGPLLESPGGRLQESYRRFPTISSIFGARRSPLYSIWPGNPISRRVFYGDSTFEKPTPVDVIGGAVLAFSRHVLEITGGMDNGFFMYLEDTDFCRRIINAGYEVYILPDVRVKHFWAGATKKRPYLMVLTHYISLGRYFLKHDPVRFTVYIVISPLLVCFLLTQWMLTALGFQNS
jgi:N-acetylglucosaminyl-diphospho-decaprenol L-rhamnosyltransferase